MLEKFLIKCKRPIPVFMAVITLILAMSSCSTSKCVLCDLDNKTVYNVELTEGSAEKYSKDHFLTFFSPIPMKAGKDKYRLYVVDCEDKEPYQLEVGEAMADFVRENMVVVDTVDVKQICKTSDADIFPRCYTMNELLLENQDLQLCERYRNPLKFEIRAMFGARNMFDNSAYVPVPGADPIEKKVLGFGEEGTKLVLGPEFAVLPSLLSVADKHRLHLGLMSGLWPVDGGLFTPLAIHPRFTFNDISTPLSGQCNAWYIFGDLGTAYDLKGDWNKFWSKNKLLPNSLFWDLGIGVDLWKMQWYDLSFDIGYRNTTLALSRNETNQDWLDCLEENGVAYSAYTKRKAGQLFIRIGLTF